MPKLYNIPKVLARLGIQKNSHKISDYETAKGWLYYKLIDSADYEKYLKEISKYVGA